MALLLPAASPSRMRCGGYKCKRQRHWILVDCLDPRSGRGQASRMTDGGGRGLSMFSHSLTILAPSFPSFVRQPPQSPLSGGLLRANGSADQGVGLASPQSPLSGGLLRAPLIRGGRGVHLLRHPPAERPLRQIRSHEKKRRRQSSGTSWPFFPSSPLGVTLHSVNACPEPVEGNE